MIKSIRDAFSQFHNQLIPSNSEIKALDEYRASIEACLKSHLNISNFFITGSIANKTEIKNYSDIDYFVVITPPNTNINSSSILKKIQTALKQCFPNTQTYIDDPAVICTFGSSTSERTEIVPATFAGIANGYEIYDIPNMNGGWTQTNPLAYNDIIKNQNERLSKKVIPLIRYIKAWKYYSTVPISSFYFEMAVAEYTSKKQNVVYTEDIENILNILLNNKLSPLTDPTGISDLILPCKTEKQKQEAIAKLDLGRTKAKMAIEAETRGELDRALVLWNNFYNNYFSQQGYNIHE